MKIHFLVIGGGVGGLCTALALCRAGHRVTVLEVEDFFEKVCLTHKVQATEFATNYFAPRLGEQQADAL